eukprot:scpid8220/ scgid34011/ Transposon Ty3-I Gag-Pol polyprotein; Gag3-Pol3; Transposon Ty3-2 TYA-TYB polyprotein; Capsid protein; p24; Spacer peptide p3; Nucleocapsid protein p11; Ty3 protease; p16; Spacer peptide J; Reverse transcriptase/ribonuclease H; p55; Integrase p52; Integrase p49
MPPPPVPVEKIDAYIEKNCCHLSPTDRSTLRDLLLQYHDVFALHPDDHGYCDLAPHKIDTGDHSPIKQQPYRVPFRHREQLQNIINDLLQKGVITPSASPWASPVVLVPKKDGSLRLCVDYRRLNKITTADAYPLPRVDDTLDAFSGSKVFSTLDLASGYWQIAIHPQDQAKTAFVTPLGLYEFTVLPMGCCNGPATFQRLMQTILNNLLTSPDPVCRVFFVNQTLALGQPQLALAWMASGPFSRVFVGTISSFGLRNALSCSPALSSLVWTSVPMAFTPQLRRFTILFTGVRRHPFVKCVVFSASLGITGNLFRTSRKLPPHWPHSLRKMRSFPGVLLVRLLSVY